MDSSKDLEYTTPEILAGLLSAVEPQIVQKGWRIFPSSFDSKDKNLRAFPRAIHWRWTSCEQALRAFGARAVMTRLPHFWQLESPLHASCRSAGAPIFINEPENMPVGAAAVASAEIDTVVTETSDSFAFTLFLLEHNVPLPKGWLLIHRADAPEWNTPVPLEQGDITVVQEVHMFPGAPILVQCPELAHSKKSVFHVSDEYVLDIQEKGVFVSSVGDEPFPLHRFRLPIALRETGTCPCGKIMFERKIL